MSDDNSTDRLDAKLKAMDLPELQQYYATAKFTDRLINVVGVALTLLMLSFTGIITLVPGIFLLYILSNISISIAKILPLICLHIEIREIGDK